MEQFVVWLELLICQFARCADSLVIANLGFAEWQALLLHVFGFGQDGWQRLLLIVDMVAPIWNLQELCRWRKVKPSPYVHQNKKRLVLHRLYSGRSTRQNIVLETFGGQGHCYLVSLVGGEVEARGATDFTSSFRGTALTIWPPMWILQDWHFSWSCYFLNYHCNSFRLVV